MMLQISSWRIAVATAKRMMHQHSSAVLEMSNQIVRLLLRRPSIASMWFWLAPPQPLLSPRKPLELWLVLRRLRIPNSGMRTRLCRVL
jgi:hypothetical protein